MANSARDRRDRSCRIGSKSLNLFVNSISSTKPNKNRKGSRESTTMMYNSQESQFADPRDSNPSVEPNSQSRPPRTRRNTLEIGIRASDPVIEGCESLEDWTTHRDTVVDELNPVGALETAYARRAAVYLWRLDRVIRDEIAAIKEEDRREDSDRNDDRSRPIRSDRSIPDRPSLQTIIKYESHLDRRLASTLAELRRLQKDRRLGLRVVDELSSSVNGSFDAAGLASVSQSEPARPCDDRNATLVRGDFVNPTRVEKSDSQAPSPLNAQSPSPTPSRTLSPSPSPSRTPSPSQDSTARASSTKGMPASESFHTATNGGDSFVALASKVPQGSSSVTVAAVRSESSDRAVSSDKPVIDRARSVSPAHPFSPIPTDSRSASDPTSRKNPASRRASPLPGLSSRRERIAKVNRGKDSRRSIRGKDATSANRIKETTSGGIMTPSATSWTLDFAMIPGNATFA